MSLKHLSCPSKILAASITAAATSFKLNNIKGWDDVNLTSADFGSQAFAVIRNANNTILELIEFDPATIADASITILKRGLKFTGDLTTEVTANKLAWTKGDTFVDIGVDTPQMYQWLQEYVDAAIVAGGVPSTTAVLGLVKMSTAPASAASPIAVGDNDPRVPTQAENDAAAGGATFGTPSSTNKFLTQNYNASATGVPTIQTFTASGTWTKPTGLKYIIIEGVGGGGGGEASGSTNGNIGNGGSAGGYFKKLILAASLGATETVTIGAAGAGGSGSDVDGSAGGNTTFGAHATGNGGLGGTGNGNASVVAGGTATGGDLNIQGGSAGSGGNTNGRGGDSQFGFGGIPISNSSSTGTGYGSGGSAGYCSSSSTSRAGAAGTAGYIIVTEYYS